MGESCSNVIMGIHIGHDRGAALVIDGVIISAIAEERLDRVKYSSSDSLPMKSVKYVLEHANLNIFDVNSVVLTHSGAFLNEVVINSWKREVNQVFRIGSNQIHVLNHHIAHASLAFYLSPFDEAAIATFDGGGDLIDEDSFEAESYFIGYQNKIKTLHKRFQENTIKCGSALCGHRFDYMLEKNKIRKISLGKKYEQLTYLCGFKFGQAGKTMGLAPYGKSLIDFEINLNGLDVDLFYGDYLKQLHQLYSESPLSYSEFIEKNKASIAFDIQNALSKTLVKLLTNLKETSGKDNLCLAGGVFLNSVANFKILNESGFRNIFIPPPAGDDGLALGAAVWGSVNLFDQLPPKKQLSPYLGMSYKNDELHSFLRETDYNHIVFESPDELARVVARLLYEGNVIGLLNGRSEIGPRALGNRSILASPLLSEMKDHINKNIKFREDFRPFAPVVIEDRAKFYFDISVPSPYMLFVAPVRNEYQSRLVGITHVDGTARLQTISASQNLKLYSILDHFEQISGYPILINTSFNTSYEPMVETPRDAILTFGNSNLDFILINETLIFREKNHIEHKPMVRTMMQ